MDLVQFNGDVSSISAPPRFDSTGFGRSARVSGLGLGKLWGQIMWDGVGPQTLAHQGTIIYNVCLCGLGGGGLGRWHGLQTLIALIQQNVCSS